MTHIHGWGSAAGFHGYQVALDPGMDLSRRNKSSVPNRRSGAPWVLAAVQAVNGPRGWSG
jgi:hypothetical protein